MGIYTTFTACYGYKCKLSKFFSEWDGKKFKFKKEFADKFDLTKTYSKEDLFKINGRESDGISIELTKITENVQIVFYTFIQREGFHGEFYGLKSDTRDKSKDVLLHECMRELLGEEYNENKIKVYVKAECECKH